MNNIFTHQPTSEELLENIKSNIPKYVFGKRLLHTLSVEKEALNIANLLFDELSIDKKYLSDISAAALLHDITKQRDTLKQKEMCKKYSLQENFLSCCDNAVLHARTGAYFAREMFGINDIVFGAIYNHTTGKANMNIFEKIIFIADYIEPTRTQEPCVKARNYFYENIPCENISLLLDKTILQSLNSTVFFLLETEKAIDVETINARNFILNDITSTRPTHI